MKTLVQKISKQSIAKAVALLKKGEVVAFPTETVYGLGANAFSAAAVKKIFAAKGRPADNPVLVHVGSLEMLHTVVRSVPPRAQKLIDAFWPGPLTLILPVAKTVPRAVTTGLSTVAVRMPSGKVALALIRGAGVPLAAPSANTSGRPSPTTAAHVLQDMRGTIPLILDGGPSQFGVESTIVDASRTPAVVLRPGAISIEAIRAVVGKVVVAGEKSKVRAPGMKYRHYAPRAVLVLVSGDVSLVRKQYTAKKVRVFRKGELTLRNLYAKLRQADEQGFEVLLATVISEKGTGVALMNRLRKAASAVVDS